MEKETMEVGEAHEDAIDRAACQVHLGAYDYDALEAAYLECEEDECQWCQDWAAARKDLESLASCGMDFCECRGTS